MESVYTIRPNKKTLNWLEHFIFEGCSSSLEDLLQLALSNSSARSFTIKEREVTGRFDGGLIQYGPIVSEWTVKRKDIKV